MQTLTSYTQTCVVVLPSHAQQPQRWSYRQSTAAVDNLTSISNRAS
jgi:hypothetical protein